VPNSDINLFKKILSAETRQKKLDDPTLLWHEQLNDEELAFVLSVFFYCRSPEYTSAGIKELIRNKADWNVRNTFPLIREYLDEELTLHLCNISQDFLSAIAKNFKNQNFYEKFIAQSQSEGKMLYYIPQEFLTMKMVETVIQRTGKALRFARAQYRTQEICKIAFNKNPEMIRYFPAQFITRKIASVAVEKDLNNIPYLSDKFLTEDLILKYLTNTPNRASVTIFEDSVDKDFDLTRANWIPRSLYTTKVLEAIATLQPFELQQVPVDLLTEDILIKAVCSNYSNSNILFRYGKNDKKIIWVPKELLSIKLLQEAVFNEPEALKYLPNTKKKKIFLDSIFLVKFQQDCLENLYKKYPRDPLKFCFSYFPENVLSSDFFSDLLVTIFIKDIWVFKGQETLKSIPESLLSTDLLLRCLEKSALLLDKDKRLSEFIFAPISKANGLSYRSWVPAKLLTSDLLQKLVFLEPESLSILPKSSINKLVKGSAFTESLRARYSRKKSVIRIIDEKLVRKVNA